MKGNFPSVLLNLENYDGTSLAKLLILGCGLSWTIFNKEEMDIMINTKQIYILEENQDNNPLMKNSILSPVNSPQQFDQELLNNFIKCGIPQENASKVGKIHFLKNSSGEKHVTISLTNLKIFIKIQILLNLSEFLIKGLPDYEDSEHKPNNCERSNCLIDSF
jgi:hypothetical protein